MKNCKQNTFLILFILASTALRAQFFEEVKVYVGFGNHYEKTNRIDTNLNLFIKQKYSIQTRIIYGMSDTYDVLGLYGTETKVFHNQTEYFMTTELLAGRIYTLNTKENLKLNLKGGFGFLKHDTPYNVAYQSSNNWSQGTSSTWTSQKYQSEITYHLVANPSIQFALSKHFEFSIAPYFNANLQKASWGIQGSFLIGFNQ